MVILEMRRRRKTNLISDTDQNFKLISDEDGEEYFYFIGQNRLLSLQSQILAKNSATLFSNFSGSDWSFPIKKTATFH